MFAYRSLISPDPLRLVIADPEEIEALPAWAVAILRAADAAGCHAYVSAYGECYVRVRLCPCVDKGDIRLVLSLSGAEHYRLHGYNRSGVLLCHSLDHEVECWVARKPNTSDVRESFLINEVFGPRPNPTDFAEYEECAQRYQGVLDEDVPAE